SPSGIIVPRVITTGRSNRSRYASGMLAVIKKLLRDLCPAGAQIPHLLVSAPQYITSRLGHRFRGETQLFVNHFVGCRGPAALQGYHAPPITHEAHPAHRMPRFHSHASGEAGRQDAVAVFLALAGK